MVCFAAGSCAPVPRPATPPPAAAPRPLPPRSPAAPTSFGLRGALSQGGLVLGTAPAGTVTLRLDGQPVPLAPDGRFVIAFGRDHGPSARLEAQLADGTTRAQTLSVAPRAWDIQSLPTLPKGTTPTPAFLARRKVELAQINAARAMNMESDGWRQPFRWPVLGRISGVFGSQRIYAGEPGAPHSGVDIARPTGTPVAAPADGVVVLAADSPFTLEGNLLMIDHGMGLNSAFLHLSRIDVRAGDPVRRGQIVGAIGSTGRATGPHLHWAMKWQAERIDPALVAGPMPRG
ncbi:M23 family metallopeptidase [Sphingomonas jatrophae]|uniref:M23 family metallopeptidase n=1 Tax=Sphingomonas jatrophae TaxID=1166337 RepID=UPI003BFA22E1